MDFFEEQREHSDCHLGRLEFDVDEFVGAVAVEGGSAEANAACAGVDVERCDGEVCVEGGAGGVDEAGFYGVGVHEPWSDEDDAEGGDDDEE